MYYVVSSITIFVQVWRQQRGGKGCFSITDFCWQGRWVLVQKGPKVAKNTNAPPRCPYWGNESTFGKHQVCIKHSWTWLAKVLDHPNNGELLQKCPISFVKSVYLVTPSTWIICITLSDTQCKCQSQQKHPGLRKGWRPRNLCRSSSQDSSSSLSFSWVSFYGSRGTSSAGGGLTACKVW